MHYRLQPVPVITAGQYGFHFITFQIFQLMRESSAGFGVGSRSIAVIFSVKAVFSASFLFQLCHPAGRICFPKSQCTNTALAKDAMDGTKYTFCHPTASAVSFAVIEYIAVFLSLVGRRSRNITVTFAVDVAAIENSRRPTEYKIHCSLYITILIILPHSFP